MKDRPLPPASSRAKRDREGWVTKVLPLRVIAYAVDGGAIVGVDAPTWELVRDNGDGTWTVRLPG